MGRTSGHFPGWVSGQIGSTNRSRVCRFQRASWAEPGDRLSRNPSRSDRRRRRQCAGMLFAFGNGADPRTFYPRRFRNAATLDFPNERPHWPKATGLPPTTRAGHAVVQVPAQAAEVRRSACFGSHPLSDRAPSPRPQRRQAEPHRPVAEWRGLIVVQLISRAGRTGSERQWL